VTAPRRRSSGGMVSPPALLLAAAAVAAAVLAVLGAGSSTHRVTARFSDADGLVAGNQVRIAGVPAGTVRSVTVGTDPDTGRPYAEAALDIDGAHWPLHSGTRIAVRPLGVLSNVYVDIAPGPRNAPPLPDSQVVGVAQTSSPVTLDQLNDVFTADVRGAIRTMLQQGVVALGGRGAADLNATIAQLDPLTAALVPLTGVLAERSPELDRLNGEIDTVTQELVSEDRHLRGLIASGDTALGALAARQRQLQGTLDHAAGTLTSLDQGLRGESGNLAAVLDKGPGALRNLQQAAVVLAPLIAAVDPHVPHLDVLLDEFVSGTGYSVDGVYTLRVDPVLNQPGRDAQACGGQHTASSDEQRTCPFTPSYRLGGAPGAPGGAAQADAAVGAGGGDGSFDLEGMFG
jgi:phospholipid/cholesterol/gamma-HCH transport system substrate-binding protein